MTDQGKSSPRRQNKLPRGHPKSRQWDDGTRHALSLKPGVLHQDVPSESLSPQPRSPDLVQRTILHTSSDLPEFLMKETQAIPSRSVQWSNDMQSPNDDIPPVSTATHHPAPRLSPELISSPQSPTRLSEYSTSLPQFGASRQVDPRYWPAHGRRVSSGSPKYQSSKMYQGKISGHMQFPYSNTSAHSTDNRSANCQVKFRKFDSLTSNCSGPASPSRDILLVGYDDGVDVLEISRAGSKILGGIRGLSGRITSAASLSWTLQHDSIPGNVPLIAVVRLSPRTSQDSTDDHVDPYNDVFTDLSLWQTHVEVYSLNNAKRISVLYRSEVFEISAHEYHTFDVRQIPGGDVRIDANQYGHITVASASSGEIFIFKSSDTVTSASCSFQCVGKIWTSVHRPSSRSTLSLEDSTHPGEFEECQYPTPLFALSERWLAIMPPDTPTSASARGTLPCGTRDEKIPGMLTLTAPLPPSVTCLLQPLEGDTLVNRMAKSVTQEVVKGARWVGGQGMQAWKNYWNSDSSAVAPGREPEFRRSEQSSETAREKFPPTHGYKHSALSDECATGNISIIDLNFLQSTNSEQLEPIATFPAPSGCSRLSFSPSGLNLLVVNNKGDEQVIWDLMGLQASPLGTILHNNSSGRLSKPTIAEPSVKMVTKFTRFTDTSVVDVVWSMPAGNRLALVTARGTLHLFNLEGSLADSLSSYRVNWPTHSTGADFDLAGQHAEKGSGFSSPQYYSSLLNTAMERIGETARPIVLSARTRSFGSDAKSPVSTFGPSTLALTAKGGKALTAGLNKSYEAASESLNQLRHSGENRLRLDAGSKGIGPGCVKFLAGQDEGFIATVAADVLKIHAIRDLSPAQHGQRRISISKGHFIEYTLPARQNAPSAQNSDSDNTPPDWKLKGFWQPVSDKHSDLCRAQDHLQPLASAEIDVCASPGKLFHKSGNRRVFVVKKPTEQDPNASPHNLGDHDLWGFGTLSMLKLTRVTRDDFEHSAHHKDAAKIRGSAHTNTATLPNTRISNASTESDQLFEDDCEVVEYTEQL